VAILESQSAASSSRYRSLIKTGAGAPQTSQPFVVQSIAPIRTKLVVARVMPIKQVGGPLFLFGLWSAAVLLVPGRWRRTRARLASAG
jgi:hypothetical protein